MKILLKYSALIFIGALFFACQNPKPKQNNELDHSSLKSEISAEWNAFFNAWVNGDASKSASFFTDDGIHFRPGAAIDSSKQNIEKTFTRMLNAFKVEYCQQSTYEIEVIGDKIIEYGTYEQKWAHADDIMKGSYIAIWESTDEGMLKISRLIFN